MKNYIAGAVIICLAVVLGVLIGNHYANLGANTGPQHYNREYFYGGLVQGGGIDTETAGATTTLTATTICEKSLIKWAASVTSSTMTFPVATSTINKCLAKDGDYKDLLLWNTSAVATHTIVFTAGTGNTLFIPEASGADKVIEYANIVRLRVLRVSSTAAYIIIDEELVQ